MSENKKTRITKIKMVKSHLLQGRSITSLEAIELYGATRLSAIIFKLKKRGLNIGKVSKTTKDRYGNYVTYAKYSLIDSDDVVGNDLLSSENTDEYSHLFTNDVDTEPKAETKEETENNFFKRLWLKITSEE